MSTIDIVEAFVGESLTATIAGRLSAAPLDHIAVLVERLAPEYYDWLEKQQAARAASDAPEVWHALESIVPRVPVADVLARSRNLLLYLPRITACDPVAHLMWAPITFGAISGELVVREEGEFRASLRRALTFLAQLRPLVVNGCVELIPSPFAADYEIVQQGARDELDCHRSSAAGQEALPEAQIGEVVVQGQICKHCDYSPLVTNQVVDRVLHEYFRELRQRSTRMNAQIADGLLNCRLPCISGFNLDDVVRLRENEDAFVAWRQSLKEIMSRVHYDSGGDLETSHREIREAADDVLRPRVAAIDEKLRGSSALTKIFVPGALAISGNLITMAFTHALPSVPYGGLVAAGLMPISWWAEKLYFRYCKAGRKSALLKDLYLRMIENN